MPYALQTMQERSFRGTLAQDCHLQFLQSVIFATHDPCAGVRVPTNADNDERPAYILTPEQAAAIFAAADADDLRLGRSFAGPLIRLAFGTGLRLGELLALRWGPDGLDLTNATVRVCRSLDRVRDASGSYPIVCLG
jgi:integrase